jgi:hypothetical protein
MGVHISHFVDILSPKAARTAVQRQASSKPTVAEPVRFNAAQVTTQGLLGGLVAQSAAEDAVHQALGYVSSEDESTVSQLLLELAGRSTDAPGMSWRCGVTSPQQNSNMRLDEMHSAVAGVLGRLQV